MIRNIEIEFYNLAGFFITDRQVTRGFIGNNQKTAEPKDMKKI